MNKNNSQGNTLLFDSRFMSVIFFVCSIMVVGIHSYNIDSASINSIASYVEGFFCHGLFIAAVPIFFYLSGYLFFRNIDTVTAVLSKMKTRIKSVLMPFLAWSTIYFLFFLAASRAFGIELTNSIVLTPFNVIKAIVFYQYSYPLWYMYQLTMFLLLTPIIHIIIKKRFLSVCLLVVCFLYSVFIKDTVDIWIFDNSTRSLFQFNFFCYYFAGCMSVKFANEINKLKEILYRNKRTSIIITFLITIAFSVFCSLAYDERIPIFYDRIFVPIVAVSLFIFIGLIFEKISYPKQVSTMIVYGVHSLIGLCLSYVYAPFLPYVPKLVMFILSMIITSVLSCLVSYVLKRFLKPIYFVLSGGR